jgi:hypothetical protein
MKFAGRWFTSFGNMTLQQDGERVNGTYGRIGTENVIGGTLSAGRLTFSYEEPFEKGTGWFRLKRHGSFAGEYLAEGSPRPQLWQGWRDFDGLWDTPLGRLRLVQEETRVHGCSEHDAPAGLEGRIEGGRLEFALNGPTLSGCGSLELDPVGLAVNGEWHEAGKPMRALGGQRVLPRQALTWLVVLEAHWQRALDDSEYAFGHMLHELFARVPRALVRHRFYHDEASLLHWCRQLIFLPEPAILLITGHGVANGLTVNGKIIELHKAIDCLRLADSLQLLHFSSCLVGQDTGQALRAAPFPISGYMTSVDWAQSALTEFIYLDMMLEKGLRPANAAEQLLRLVRFAGTEEIPGSPYRAAGFCFFAPGG